VLSRVTLEPEASAAPCKQLVADLAGLATIQELDRWAQTCLPAKNTLTAADGRLVEEAFQGVLNAADPRRYSHISQPREKKMASTTFTLCVDIDVKKRLLRLAR
jgi:hypothetical protein